MTTTAHHDDAASDPAGSHPGASAPVTHVHPIWLARAFLLPRCGEGYPDAPEWRRAPHWFLLWGAAIGIVYAGVFRASWRWFGEYQYVRFVPIAVVLLVDLAWGGYRPFVAAVRLLAGGRSRTAETVMVHIALAVVLIAFVKYAMLLSLPLGDPEWSRWRGRLGILYPKAIYRPLVLMPLWGRWAMTLALCIGRPHADEPAPLRSMAANARLPWILLGWLACGALTVFYASETAAEAARGTVIALGVLVSAYLVSFALGRRCGGQTQTTVLAAALATEFSFLALYLPIASKGYY